MSCTGLRADCCVSCIGLRTDCCVSCTRLRADYFVSCTELRADYFVSCTELRADCCVPCTGLRADCSNADWVLIQKLPNVNIFAPRRFVSFSQQRTLRVNTQKTITGFELPLSN
jgi:hypothetical protein